MGPNQVAGKTTESKELLASGPESLGLRLWHAMHGWQRYLEHTLAPLGLTHLQFVILSATSYLVREGEIPTQGRLSEFTRFDRMMLSKILRLLETRGLVARTPHPSVTRANAVTLTAAGAETLASAVPLWRAANHAYFGKLGRSRLPEFDRMLVDLAASDGNSAP